MEDLKGSRFKILIDLGMKVIKYRHITNFVSHLYLQWLQEFIPYMNEWEASVSERSGFSNQAKSMILLAKKDTSWDYYY